MYVSTSNSPVTMSSVSTSPSLRRAIGLTGKGPALVFARERVQELDDEADILLGKDPAQLRLRHDIDGLLQGWGSTIVKIRGGHRNIPEARHTEDVPILVIVGDGEASKVGLGDTLLWDSGS